MIRLARRESTRRPLPRTPCNRDFRVGLPEFEPGTSASRTEPGRVLALPVLRRISENVLVTCQISESPADRQRPRNTAILRRSAPFPRQCAPMAEIPFTQIRDHHLRRRLFEPRRLPQFQKNTSPCSLKRVGSTMVVCALFGISVLGRCVRLKRMEVASRQP